MKKLSVFRHFRDKNGNLFNCFPHYHHDHHDHHHHHNFGSWKKKHEQCILLCCQCRQRNRNLLNNFLCHIHLDCIKIKIFSHLANTINQCNTSCQCNIFCHLANAGTKRSAGTESQWWVLGTDSSEWDTKNTKQNTTKIQNKIPKKHNTPAPQLPPPLNYFVIVARFWDTELLSNLHFFCFPGIILGPQWHLLKCDMCSPANLIWCFLWSGVQNYKIQRCGELKTYVLGSPHSAMETHRKRTDIWQPNLE